LARDLNSQIQIPVPPILAAAVLFHKHGKHVTMQGQSRAENAVLLQQANIIDDIVAALSGAICPSPVPCHLEAYIYLYSKQQLKAIALLLACASRCLKVIADSRCESKSRLGFWQFPPDC